MHKAQYRLKYQNQPYCLPTKISKQTRLFHPSISINIPLIVAGEKNK